MSFVVFRREDMAEQGGDGLFPATLLQIAHRSEVSLGSIFIEPSRAVSLIDDSQRSDVLP